MAQFVNDDDVEKEGSLPSGRGHVIRRLLMNMKAGQILKVTRAEWDWKSRNPNAIVKDIERKTTKRFEFSDSGDFKAWFIRRIE